MGRRHDQIEALSSQRHERQVVGEGGRLARDPDICEARRDGGRDLEVASGLGLVPGELAGRDAVTGQFAVEHPASLCTGLSVDEAETSRSDVGHASDLGSQTRPQHQALPPRTEADHVAAAAQQLTSWSCVVVTRLAAQVRPSDMDKSIAGQAQRLLTGARPPGERHRRIEEAQRHLEERQRRITAGHHQRRPRRSERDDLAGPVTRPPAGAKPAR